ncbi:MAG TPA: carboxylating nicotinate-nucleotide diphosphorylase [Cytophagales bacterium]|nr:carboxylating nicotinate-nucleotide diphosphorylase [Cytophagales bacterium]
MEYLSEIALNSFISMALAEDLGEGDHSSQGAIPESAQNKAQLIIKDEGILAGVNLAERIFHKVDPKLTFSLLIKDGKPVKYGDIAFTVEGSSRSILIGERLALNCMQRMSGIATYTKHLSSLIEGTGAKLLDTRKTTPNFRMMEKWAVVIGGGHNHRYGLFDMVILKDNHVDFSGGIRQAITNTKAYLKKIGKEDIKIEIETRTLKEVEEALEVGGIDRIMLDNMSNDTMRAAVQLINKQYEVEASGGVNEKTIKGIADTGVDYISVGALTHSIKSLDMSLKAIHRLA